VYSLCKYFVVDLMGVLHIESGIAMLDNHFSSLILFEEYTSGVRSKEMHVHIDDKENEKILNYIKLKHAGI
jgi:hypothetical protein